MNYKILFLLLVMCTYTLSIAAGGVLTGAGTDLSPYLIEDYDDLKVVTDDKTAWYRLANTIDASASRAESFVPIGTSGSGFSGHFNGAGYQIISLNIQVANQSYVGLFGNVSVGGTIDSLGVLGSVLGYNYVGGIVGHMSGSVTHSYFMGSIKGQTYVGGIVGQSVAGSVITSSFSNGQISAYQYSGGFVGLHYGSISNCFSGMKFTYAGYRYFGGLVGYNAGTIDESYSYGTILSSSRSGGLVGYVSGGTTTKSYWDIEASGRTASVGSNGADYKGLTTAEMKAALSYDSWDFTDTWSIVEDTFYPQLQGIKDVPWGMADTTVSAVDTTDMTEFLSNDLTFAETVPTEARFEYISGHGNNLLYWYRPGTVITVGDTVWGDVVSVLGPQIEIAIASYDDLKKIGTDDAYPLYASYRLTQTINAAASKDENGQLGFIPIGSNDTPFTGSFHGNGFHILDLTINRKGEDRVGLFSTLDTFALVDSLGLTGTFIGNSYVGSIAGYTYGLISESFASVSVECYTYCGGIAGRLQRGTIRNVYSSGLVSGQSYIGGLAGRTYYGSIENAFSTAQVVGFTYVGGIIGGYSSGTRSNSYWSLALSKIATSAGSNSQVKGLTTVEMKQEALFNSWDFVDTWKIREDISFPGLRAVKNVPIAVPDTIPVTPDSTNLAPYLSNDVMAENESITEWKFIELNGVGEEAHYWYAPGVLLAGGDTLWGAKTAVTSPQVVQPLSSYADLKKIGVDPDYSLGGSYRLTQNIDASLSSSETGGFAPIGLGGQAFTGKFNGAGFRIMNLTIDRPSNDTVGMFSVLGMGSIVDSVILSVNVVGDQYTGGLVGFSYGTISNSRVSGDITAASATGGVVGQQQLGTIVKTVSNVNVSSNSSYIGGFVGRSNASISECYSTGVVYGGNYTGGFIGYLSGSIEKSFSTGSVVAGTYVGGFVGYISSASLNEVYSIGSVIGNESNTGGLVGYASGITIRNSYWDIDRSGQAFSSGGGSGVDYRGLSSENMKKESSFRNWDFSVGWEIREDFSYPNIAVLADIPLGTNDGFKASIDSLNMVDFLINDVNLDGSQPTEWKFIEFKNVGGNAQYWYQPGKVLPEGDTLWGVASYGYTTQVVTPLTSYEDLKKIGLDAAYPLDGSYRLTADIDASLSYTENGNRGFIPIALNSDPFTGKINGAGFSIHGLFIDSYSDDIGLVSVLGSNAIIDSLTVKGEISGDDRVGGLAGTSRGVIAHSHFNGTIGGDNYLGGIVGILTNGSVSRSTAKVIMSNYGDNYVGGLIGRSLGDVSFCYSNSSILGYQYVGGLIGYNRGAIHNSYSTGSVVSSSQNVGGLVGYTEGNISNSYSVSTVKGSQNVGGLVGYLDGSISNSYATGFVSGPQGTGGLVGYNDDGVVMNSYWNTELTGQFVSYASDGTSYKGLSSSEMKQQVQFLGWDFTTQWQIQEGSSFPGLQGINDAPLTVSNKASIVDTLDMSAYLVNDTDPDGTTPTEWQYTSLDSAGGLYRYWYRAGEILSIGDTLWGSISFVSTPQTIIPISNYTELKLIGTTPQYPLSGYYVLSNSIDASASVSENSGDGFLPIANGVSSGFTGKFDGAGYTIQNLTINRDSDNIGLFSTIGTDGVITNLSLTGIFTGDDYVGALAGNSYGTIDSVSFNGSVTGDSYVGGLLGSQYRGAVTASQSNATVTGTNQYVGGLAGSVQGFISLSNATGTVIGDNYYVGGFAGYITGSVTQSFSNAAVTGNYYYSGGFVGYSSGSISKCHSAGSVTANGQYSGGFIGYSAGAISSSFSLSTVTSDAYYTGGFVGYVQSGTISESYSAGSVESDAFYTGGFAGYVNGTIKNSYTSSSVDGYYYVGGFVGSANGIIENSYSVGDVRGSYNIGGFSGSELRGVSRSYWSKELSSRTTTSGRESNASGALSVEQFTMKGSFTQWDFLATWEIIEGRSYPGLIAVNDVSIGVPDTTLLAVDKANLSFALLNDIDVDGVQPTEWKLISDDTFSGMYRYVYIPGELLSTGDTLWGTPATIISPQPVIEISNYTELKLIGSHASFPVDGNYRIIHSIDASLSAIENGGLGFDPLTPVDAFTGRLNGGGYSILDLTINREDSNSVGLFSHIGVGGLIDSLTITGTITGNDSVGTFCGVGDTSMVITNSIAKTVVTGNVYVGGLVGYTKRNALINHSTSYATVSGEQYVGGLAGGYYGTIENSYMLGKVTGAQSYVGGLSGYFSGEMLYSYSIGEITGLDYVGGLIGYLEGVIDRSYSSGVTNGDDYVGGLVGYINEPSSGGSSSSQVAESLVKNSYSTSKVKGDEDIGGLVGSNESDIYMTYSTGQVSGNDEIGGLVGGYYNGDVSHSFWGITLSNQSWSSGENGTDYRGLSLEELKNQSSYLYWDFNSIWSMNGSTPGITGLDNAPIAVPDTFEVGREFDLAKLLENDFDIDSETTQLELHIDSIFGSGDTDRKEWYRFGNSVPAGTVDTVLYKLMKETSLGDTLWSYGTAYLTNVLNLFGPTTLNDSLNLNEDTAITITVAELLVNDSDGENDFIYFDSVASTNANGLVHISNDSITFTPAVDWNGITELSYVVNDGEYSDTGSVVFTVNPVNDAPVATAATPQVMNEDSSLNLTIAMVTATDIDGDALAIVVGSGLNYAVSGTVITPTPDYFGSLSVPVQATDGIDTSASVLLTVLVTDVPEIVVSSSSTMVTSSVAQSSTTSSTTGTGLSSVVQSSADGSGTGVSSSATTTPSSGVSSSAVVAASSVIGVPGEPGTGLSSTPLSSSSVLPLSSVVISPIYTNNSQEGVLFTQVINTIDLNSFILSAPETATSFEVYSIHGTRISSGYVNEGTLSLASTIAGGVVIIKYK